MARQVPISPDNVRPGQAWWKCPYCKAGGQKIQSSWRAEMQAEYHFIGHHPFRTFKPHRPKR